MRSKHLLLMLLLALMAPWAAAQTQLNEGFEGTTFPPTDWTSIHVSGSSAWTRSTGTGAGSSTAFAYRQEVSGGYEDYLITPKLEPKSGEQLSFYLASYYASSFAGTTLTIKVSTTTPEIASFTDLTSWTSGSSGTFGTNGSSDWVKKTVDVSAYVGQQIYIAFHAKDPGYDADIRIDNVSGVSLYVPACPKPQNLAVSNITNEGATITWEAPTTATPTGYKYQYKPEGGTWSNLTSTTALSANLTGLTSNTEYTFQVKAIYSDGESEFATKTFTTNLCADADMCEISYVLTGGYYDDYFDEWYGWSGAKINVVDHETGIIVSTLTLANSDPQSGISGSLYLCDGESIDFVWVAGQWGGWYDNYCEYTFLDVNGEEIFSGEGALSSTVNYSMSCTIVTCLKPTGLTVNSKTNETATISWTSDASNFNIQYRKITESTWNTRTSTSTSYTITGLESGTEYEVQVQANCGGGSLSNWTTSKNFTTNFCTDADMCEITLTLTDSYGDGWNGNYLQVVDVETNIVLGQFTNEDLNGTTGSGTNEENTFTLAVCDGREIKFVYVNDGSYPEENYFTIYDVNGEVICQFEKDGTGPIGFEYTYTVDCAVATCLKPTNLTVTVGAKT